MSCYSACTQDREREREKDRKRETKRKSVRGGGGGRPGQGEKSKEQRTLAAAPSHIDDRLRARGRKQKKEDPGRPQEEKRRGDRRRGRKGGEGTESEGTQNSQPDTTIQRHSGTQNASCFYLAHHAVLLLENFSVSRLAGFLFVMVLVWGLPRHNASFGIAGNGILLGFCRMKGEMLSVFFAELCFGEPLHLFCVFQSSHCLSFFIIVLVFFFTEAFRL